MLLHRCVTSCNQCSVAWKNVCNKRRDFYFGGGGGRGTCKAKWITLSLSVKLIFFLGDVRAFAPFCTSTNSELDISIAVVVTTFLSNCNMLITNHLSILYLIVCSMFTWSGVCNRAVCEK
jgi:hypothetical protein